MTLGKTTNASRDSKPSRRDRRSFDRRAYLGGLASATLVGTAGCLERSSGLLARDRGQRVSLTIRTLPADADPRATRIARFLADHLQNVGVDAQVVLVNRETLYRDVLLDQNFDLYVGQPPDWDDPDFLYGLLHSRFEADPGWQNPFGYVNSDVDALLERQRRQSRNARRKALIELQQEIARTQPFTVVAFPDEVRTVRTGRVTGWRRNVHAPLSYLALEVDDRSSDGTRDGSSASDATPEDGTPTEDGSRQSERRGVRMALTDPRPLKNLNPLSVEVRGDGVITELLYDPLGRRMGKRVRPWLAASWNWRDGAGQTLDVRLREDLQWHDGASLTAADVAFTYRFLRDTSLGTFDEPVPSTRFQNRTSLVTDAQAIGDRTVRLQFRKSSDQVALSALTVPVLPAHVWEETATEAIGDIESGGATKALARNNRQPIGSGPLKLETFNVRESLALAPFEEHFLTSTSASHLESYRGGPEPLVFHRAPSSAAAVALVRDADADATASSVLPKNVPSIGHNDDLRLTVHPSQTFYHVGYNARRTPLDDVQFRRAVARLLDKEYFVREVFDEYATPAATPLARHDTVAPTLTWNGTDPVLPFAGSNGTLDAEEAQQAFQEAGYEYESDKLYRD